MFWLEYTTEFLAWISTRVVAVVIHGMLRLFLAVFLVQRRIQAAPQTKPRLPAPTTAAPAPVAVVRQRAVDEPTSTPNSDGVLRLRCGASLQEPRKPRLVPVVIIIAVAVAVAVLLGSHEG
jgi:hypothetical protein